MNEVISQIPWKLVVPIFLLNLILIIVALFSLWKAEKTNGPKWIWLLAIVLVNLLGPVAFFIFGRRND
jgi:hypothetical protein